MSINSIPHKDHDIKGHITGRTKHGLQYDLEVGNGATTNAVAKEKSQERFPQLRDRVIGFRAAAAQPEKVIHLRLATPNGIKKIIIESGNEYKAAGKQNRSLKELVSSIAEDIEASVGLGRKAQGSRWGI